MKRLVLAAAAAVVFALFGAGADSAFAHTALQSTEPADGAVVTASASKVLLRFNQPVDAPAGGVRVFTADGTRVDEGRDPSAAPGDKKTVEFDLPALSAGTYVVTWRVVSQDAHPLNGVFSFTVAPAASPTSTSVLAPGETTTTTAPAAPPDLRKFDVDGGSSVVGLLWGVVRFLAFLSLLVLVGGAAFVAWLWPAGWADRRARRMLAGALIVAVVSAIAGIGLQGAYGSGLPLADALSPDVLRRVMRSRFGKVWLGRVGLLAVFWAFLAMVRKRESKPVDVFLTVLVGVVLLATPGFSGHAASGDLRLLATASDTLHMAAAAVWLGGLAMLLAAVLRHGPADSDDDAAAVVPLFSKIALWAVVVLVATGSFQSWRQVRELDALTSTTYGRTLMVKLGLFAGLVVLAAVSRAMVLGKRPLAETVGRLRATVLAEAAIAVVVLGVTASLVNAVPARIAVARPETVEVEVAGLFVETTIDPAKAGPAAVHLYTFTPTGQVAEADDVRVVMRRAGRVVEVPVRRAGPGHFAAYGFVIPEPGTWRLEVVIAGQTAGDDIHIR